jgi:single-strand selective monofunctional uracil DNA glycosylase
MMHARIIDRLLEALRPLAFAAPVTHVYNPLEYARRPYDAYLAAYGRPPKAVLLVGMNPGPWGMAQTGVPFGEVGAVRDWLGIAAPVGRPAMAHPRRPVEGFACRRAEVSGRRLWGWARKNFGTPEAFFRCFFVANYCPLLFLEADGRNRTPDKLPRAERKALEAACDQAVRDLALHLECRTVLGIGRFAAARVAEALAGTAVTTGGITHPSPANPRANRGWEALVSAELAELGIRLPPPAA